MKNEKLNIINNIKHLLETHDMSISDLARLAKVQRVAISRALSGKTELRDVTLSKIAKAFRVNVAFLRNEPQFNLYPSLDYNAEKGTLEIRLGGEITDPYAEIEKFKVAHPDAVMGETPPQSPDRANLILAIQARLTALDERELRLILGFLDDLDSHRTVETSPTVRAK